MSLVNEANDIEYVPDIEDVIVEDDKCFCIKVWIGAFSCVILLPSLTLLLIFLFASYAT